MTSGSRKCPSLSSSSPRQKQKDKLNANQYLEIQKLLDTWPHLSRQMAAEHFKFFVHGSRNDMTIIYSDKTFICLQNVIDFVGSLVHHKGRVFFLIMKNDLKDEVLEHMALRIGCTHDSYMGIPDFSTNTLGLMKNNSKKMRINFSGEHQKPDCFVIFGLQSTDRKLVVIQEADRSQIPIICLVDSAMPLQYYKRITYLISDVDTTEFIHVLQFDHEDCSSRSGKRWRG